MTWPQNVGNRISENFKLFLGRMPPYPQITLLQSLTKLLVRLPTFAASVWEIYQFIPNPPSPCSFNVVYRDEFVIARFQHCLGGGGGFLFQ